MNKKILALTLVLLLTTIYISSVSISPTKAQNTTSGWITSYDVYDYNSNLHLASYSASTGNQSLAPIAPGEVIKVVFTINVFTAGSGDLKLSTSLQNPPQGQYWTLSSQSTYSLGCNFNPNSNPASFNWVVRNLYNDSCWYRSIKLLTDYRSTCKLSNSCMVQLAAYLLIKSLYHQPAQQ